MGITSTDRIEKQVMLRTPRARVWRALSDSKEFGEWFRAEFREPFRAGAHLKGRSTYPGYENMKFELDVETMEPERKFAIRWHPDAVEPGKDYSNEPTTRVEFTLEDAKGGTLLKMVESGYENMPAARRDEAFHKNEQGWTEQMTNIETYLRNHP